MKYVDFRQITRSRSLATPVPTLAVLERLGGELVEGLFPLPLGVRLLGLTLSNLAAEAAEAGPQLTLRF